jgi:hypothetical protein
MCMDEMQQKSQQALAPRLRAKKWLQPQTPAHLSAHQDPPAPTPDPSLFLLMSPLFFFSSWSSPSSHGLLLLLLVFAF